MFGAKKPEPKPLTKKTTNLGEKKQFEPKKADPVKQPESAANKV